MDSLFFTEEHKMIQRMVSEFAKDEIIPVARELDKTGEFPKNIVKKMGSLGLMGINVPTEYGGSGLDMVSYAAAIIELAKADASIAITMAAHTSLGTLPILLYGSTSLKKNICRKLLLVKYYLLLVSQSRKLVVMLVQQRLPLLN